MRSRRGGRRRVVRGGGGKKWRGTRLGAAGAILGQSEVAIGELETAGELHDRLAEDGGPLVQRVLRELSEGRAQEREQDERLATSAPKLNREATRIEWSRDAGEIANQIRG